MDYHPRGVLEVYMTGGSDVFFWVENLHAWYFFWVKRSVKYFFIFLGLISERTFRFGFSLRSVDQKNIHSNFFSATCVPCPCIFFGLEILMPGIFLGLKFQAYVFFWVCNMKLRRTPQSCILRVPPL